MSDANPQQSKFRWGSQQLVSFRTTAGNTMRGVLLKPDGFDPARKYPMLVDIRFFRTPDFHGYMAPNCCGEQGLSAAVYLSKGYLVFKPDVDLYGPLPKGSSAVASVVGGVNALLDSGFVDRNALGLVGGSWGGYLTNYIITQTTVFKAASGQCGMANLASAYGTLRLGMDGRGGGINSAPFFERDRGGFGFPPWEHPDAYIKESPLFHLDKVQTPLLMYANENDEAVDWNQSIEMYIGLRRLKKPVFLFVYNGDGHGLRKYANRADWDIRQRQFFDHYLKGAPAPEWIMHGIPFLDKGR